jgi:predicted phosphodiesterase
MKIQVVSDLHLEFNTDIELVNAGADVLVLAGDICLADHLYSNPTAGLDNLIQKGWYAKDAIRYRKFFKQVSERFPKIIYIMGNHEHYSGRWSRTADVLRQEVARYRNIHFLEQDKLVIGDVVFLGCTLWTDLNRDDPLTEYHVKSLMNDYRAITQDTNGKFHKLNPITTRQKHHQSVEWLKMMLEEDKRKTVIVGHHAPSHQSIHPKYQNETIMNGAYVSNLEWLMVGTDHIALWVHGHVHDPHDYVVNKTRVICNPCGYPGEPKRWDPNLIIEV